MFLGISYLFEKYFQSQINSCIYFWLGHTWVLISMSFILAVNIEVFPSQLFCQSKSLLYCQFIPASLNLKTFTLSLTLVVLESAIFPY